MVILMFVAAFGLRVWQVSEPYMGFHPARQYHSAIIARGLYFESNPSIAQWRREVAAVNMGQQSIIEPPIMEYVTAFAYRVGGGEHLWIPRALSAVFWLIGGVFLYLIARKMVSQVAAAFCVALYLLLPYVVPASTTFMPDPLMVMTLLVSIFTILRHHDKPSTPRLLTAAVVSAIAIFVKPVCAFAIFGAFLALAVWGRGLRKSLISPATIGFAVVSILPTVVYIIYGTVISDFLGGAEQGRFWPNLYSQPFFWREWLFLIGYVMGYFGFILAIVGIVLTFLRRLPRSVLIALWGGYLAFLIAFVVTREPRLIYAATGYTTLVIAFWGVALLQGWSRALMVGLWAGYLVFGLVFSYHIHTHDYYHLQLIPVVAFSLAPVFALVVGLVKGKERSSPWADYWGVAIVALVLILLGVPAPLSQRPAYARQIATNQEVGERVAHATDTVFLTYGDGYPLEYCGELSGLNWPNSSDFRQYQLEGRPELNARQRFDGYCQSRSPEYFIVTDLAEYGKQTDLKTLLTANYPVLVETDDYLIFDLRGSE